MVVFVDVGYFFPQFDQMDIPTEQVDTDQLYQASPGMFQIEINSSQKLHILFLISTNSLSNYIKELNDPSDMACI